MSGSVKAVGRQRNAKRRDPYPPLGPDWVKRRPGSIPQSREVVSMALTGFQQAICHLIAANRLEYGEAYVAGGVALDLLTAGQRISRDLDLFLGNDHK